MTRTNDERFEDSRPNEGPATPKRLVDPRTWAGEDAAARWDEERPTPVRPHARPAPVVCPSVRGPHSGAPLPGPAKRSPFSNVIGVRAQRKPTDRGLGPVLDPFPAEEAPTPTVDNPEVWLVREGQRLLRNWRACPPDRRRQISAMALSYREDAEGKDRG